jgi:ABC-type nitrate/sulfonate/bicarbonate transport system permease component
MTGARRLLLTVVRLIGTVVVSTAVLLAVWQLFLEVFDVNPFVGKGPRDVWDHLFEGPRAAANRRVLFTEFRTTLRDAALGFLFGGLASCAVAVSFVLWRPIERTFMPVAMALRSVPIVAMIPVLALTFGRDLQGIVIAVSIVVFFPTLVLVTHGLRSVSNEAIELLQVYDASGFTTFRKVRIPNALPSLFAAARVAAPGAVLGALLCEWLLTGEGLGYLMLQDTTTSRYSELWAATVLVTVTSIVLYALVGAAERLVLERFAADLVERA